MIYFLNYLKHINFNKCTVSHSQENSTRTNHLINDLLLFATCNMSCMSLNITINCEVFLGSKLYSPWMLSMISCSIWPTKTHNNYLALLKLNHLWFCLLTMFIFALNILRFYKMLHTSFFLRSSSFLFFSSLICAKRCFFLSSSAFRSLLSDMMPQLYTENIVCPCVPLKIKRLYL